MTIDGHGDRKHRVDDEDVGRGRASLPRRRIERRERHTKSERAYLLCAVSDVVSERGEETETGRRKAKRTDEGRYKQREGGGAGKGERR